MSAISPASLTRNVLWNVAGQIAPLFAAVLAIPVLIRSLGIDRFGLLTLAWMVIGYFSLFDFGLGRALIKLVSEALGEGRLKEIPKLIWTALTLMALLGIGGAALIFGLTGWLVTSVLKVPENLQTEGLNSFRVLALSVPVVIFATGLRGILEAYRRFDLVNLVRIPLGILTFVAPLAVLPFSSRLDVIVTVLLGVRILLCIVNAMMSERVVPGLLRRFSYSGRLVRPMLRFGGWMTVTNVISPVMVYMDRFLISGVLGLAAVAYYVTPFEIVTKLLIIPGALVGVLFPMFSAGLATDRLQTAQLFRRSVNWLFLCVFPIVLLITVFAADGLRLWLSDEFAQRGAAVLQWLAAGVLINSLAYVPFAFVQGAGRPDLSAKLHLAELPFYLAMLWLFMQQWGIVGAAAAWTLRVSVDAIVLFAMSARLESALGGTLKKDGMIFAAALIVLALGCWPGAILSKIVFSAVVLLCFAWFGWRHLLSADERATVNSRLPHYLQG